MKFGKFYRVLRKFLIWISLFLMMSIVSIDIYIKIDTHKQIFYDPTQIPKNRVGLLLGTSKFRLDGKPNMFYKNRIDAAVQLFEADKIDFLLISGDNSTVYYNEPQTMMKDLLKRGIPKEKIFLDFAGIRTFDSVIRAREIFGLDSVTVISQKFHNERALYIANRNNITAIGYNAKQVGLKEGIKTWSRERFARIKMMLDLSFGAEPKYLGEKIDIK
jgi:SanA protein